MVRLALRVCVLGLAAFACGSACGGAPGAAGGAPPAGAGSGPPAALERGPFGTPDAVVGEVRVVSSPAHGFALRSMVRWGERWFGGFVGVSSLQGYGADLALPGAGWTSVAGAPWYSPTGHGWETLSVVGARDPASPPWILLRRDPGREVRALRPGDGREVVVWRERDDRAQELDGGFDARDASLPLVPPVRLTIGEVLEGASLGARRYFATSPAHVPSEVRLYLHAVREGRGTLERLFAARPAERQLGFTVAGDAADGPVALFEVVTSRGMGVPEVRFHLHAFDHELASRRRSEHELPGLGVVDGYVTDGGEVLLLAYTDPAPDSTSTTLVGFTRDGQPLPPRALDVHGVTNRETTGWGRCAGRDWLLAKDLDAWRGRYRLLAYQLGRGGTLAGPLVLWEAPVPRSPATSYAQIPPGERPLLGCHADEATIFADIGDAIVVTTLGPGYGRPTH